MKSFDLDRWQGPRVATLVALVVCACALRPEGAAAQLSTSRRPVQVVDRAAEIEARVWLDRGDEPQLRTGDQVRVYYRANYDAHVAIFQIDTDGTTSLLFPRSPDENHYVRGGRDYRLLFPRSPAWYVDDEPGVGYFFIIASPEPFDFSRFQYSRYDRGWDLELVGRQVYRDPYVAMDEYVAALVPDWERVPYALDFATYNVGAERYAYPRFLCYDCHGFRSYAAWNPYYATCTSFRVVIYDDPYFYPARRYRADRVVWAQHDPNRPRYAFRQRFPGDPAEPLLEQVVGERTRGVVAPAPRRSPTGGAGGVAPSGQPAVRTPVTRGGVTAPATPASGQGERADPRATVRPTDRVRLAPGAVSAPSTGTAPSAGEQPRATDAPAEGARPSGGSTGTDSRPRPVLRRRPSDAAGQPTSGTPSAQPATEPAGRGAPTTPSASPRTRPRLEPPSATRQPASRPAPQPSSERAPATRRPSGGEGSSGGSGGSSRGGDEPTVRTTPDGRPAVRRPPGA